MTGRLAIVGGGSFTESAANLGRQLLGDATEVLILATAAAFEHPERLAAQAIVWFAGLGVRADSLPVLRRADALDEVHSRRLGDVGAVYLVGEGSLHLRSVLKGTPLLSALVSLATVEGLVVGVGGAGAALTDPMTDPRGGGLALGLGIVSPVAVVPAAESVAPERLRRIHGLAGARVPVLEVHSESAAIRSSRDGWSAIGEVRVWRDGTPAGLDALP